VPAQDSSTIRYSPTRPGTAVASALEAQPVSGVTPATTYAVVSGDSLSAVAKRFHLTKSELASANRLRSGSTLHVGQRLIIPSKAASLSGAAEAAPARAAEAAPAPAASGDMVRHVVKPGETLGAIARRYGVRQGDIAVANNITDPKRIRPGQELVIPARGTAGTRPARASAPEAEQPKAPPASEDLDAGLKPASGDVPVVKVDDSAQQPKNP
jgi:LysM repeat protein